MTLSVADSKSSPSEATPSQPGLEESLNLNLVERNEAANIKAPSTTTTTTGKILNIKVHMKNLKKKSN